MAYSGGAVSWRALSYTTVFALFQGFAQLLLFDAAMIFIGSATKQRSQQADLNEYQVRSC
jgi:hypothetical protein